jgi:hypothetical protein
MRNPALGLLTVVLILSVTAAPAAAALQYKQEIEFQPGGQTIGGPGFAEFGGSFPYVVFLVHDGRAAACTTVANVGENPFDVLFDILQPGSAAVEISAGKTLTICRSDVSNISFIKCEGQERAGKSLQCKALWRVDEYRPIPDR